MKFASNDDGRSQAHDPTSPPSKTTPSSSTGANLGFGERAISAAGAAVVSAIIVNPLDVAKTRLQAQAAGFSNQGLCGAACFETNMMFPDLKQAVPGSEPLCTLECNRYKGTIDVFYKITRQEGFGRLWRGTYASLALAVPTVGIYLPCYDIFRNLLEDFTTQNVPGLTPYVPLVAGSISRSLACVTCYPLELARTRMQAFKDIQNGAKPPGVWKTLFEMINPMRGTNNLQKQQSYRILWTGLGAQLARDVPFSAICWSTLEPIRRRILTLIDDESRAASVLGANFSAGFVAGTIAAAVTCPLDVARTRRQIEKDPARALNMTTIQTLREVWRDGGVKGLFTGIGPRVARTGPSVGIVVSFYEIVKYTLHHRRHQATD
ncbi:mitochondrial carrier protein MTM1 isoform X3 [Mercurialis annua]|uniref:mitochondrial carrier protein MTM1 isoform X3 n=1 Tax=Mercurialis annua TaxID=3986 RepID=UPI00215FA3DB|nr:mitochondrial carrier protein MTM1 isoform X3 [Mercurialis annua]